MKDKNNICYHVNMNLKSVATFLKKYSSRLYSILLILTKCSVKLCHNHFRVHHDPRRTFRIRLVVRHYIFNSLPKRSWIIYII